MTRASKIGAVRCLLVTLLIVSIHSALSVTAVGQDKRRPELVIQDGHSESVSSVSFSPDGRIIASGGLDQTIKLWDARSGRLIRTINTNTETKLVAFSPDGRFLAANATDRSKSPTEGAVNLWDVRSGTLMSKFECPDKGHIVSLAFSRGGKMLAAGTGNDSMHLWDVNAGQVIRSLHGTRRYSLDSPDNSNFTHIAFSPDDKSIASGGWNQTAFLWNVGDGSLLRTFDDQGGTINAVAFSPDGGVVAAANNATIKLWEAATGKVLRSLETDSLVTDIAFGRDGKTVVGSEKQGVVVLWDAGSGRRIIRFDDTGSKVIDRRGDIVHSTVESVAISPDGEVVAGGIDDGTLGLWSVKTGKLQRVLKRQLLKTTALAVDPYHDLVAFGRKGAGVSLLDAGTAQVLCQLEDSRRMYEHWNKDLDKPFSYMVFSPDRQTVASWRVARDEGNRGRILDNSVRVWDTVSGRVRAILKIEKEMHPDLNIEVGMSPELAYSPDGKTLAVATEAAWERPIKLLDVASGKILRELQSHRSVANHLAFSPDGKILAVAADTAIKMVDVSSDKVFRVLQGGAGELAFSPDGKLIASEGYGRDRTIKLWDAAGGGLLRSFEVYKEGEEADVGQFAFSPDGQTLVAHVGRTSVIKFWNVSDGAQIRAVSVGTRIRGLAFKRNGLFIARATEENLAAQEASLSFTPNMITKILSPQGVLLATVMGFGDGNWLTVTPEGYFDGTTGAWNQVNWRFNGVEAAPVEAFFNEFYNPGLLAEILGGKSLQARADIADKDRRQTEVRFVPGDDIAPAGGTTERFLKVRLEVSEQPPDKEHKTGSGARDVRLFRNGTLARAWRGDVLGGRDAVTLEATVPVVAGENLFTAYAFNHDNVKSADASLVVNGAEALRREGTAYVLAVGVNEYANPQFNLRYAVADAHAFSAEVKRQQEGLGQFEKVEVITLINQQGTKRAILDRLAELTGQVRPEDAVIIYFAGHGTAQGNRFYLIPHDLGYAGDREKVDAGGLQEIVGHSISDEELEAAVEKMDAGKLLMVIDACNSGQALEAEERRRGPMNSKGLAQLAYEKGMYILTAAQSYQAAQEAARLGHGFLTFALVEEGMRKGAADREPRDGTVHLREWMDFAVVQVPKMQTEEMVEALRSRGLKLSFVAGEEKIEEPERRSVQRPKVFYRREADAQPLVIAKPGTPYPANR